MIALNSTTTLLACRHGQSLGNTARADAEARGLADVGIALSDAELPLTDLGHEQAARLGHQITLLPPSQRPTRIVCSPHRRALETADGVIRYGFANCRIAFTLDARLAPKSFGVLEGLTRTGVAERYPQLAAQRERVGRFHFRPPGGESRCDVVMRVHRLLADLIGRSAGERVLLVTHQIVINALDYLLHAGRDDALASDADGWVPNARLYGFALGANAGPIAEPVNTDSAVAA
ncbi:histidine phosphatase family protein [Tahibacter sp.]|uniref:histidine phosphatase family protein n=1 Tax=Tahibacter sp. TaxID=2056211 RepID=UPI0028C4FC3A|nr:histidine phosphatase family protein [Tahibacter sp.]